LSYRLYGQETTAKAAGVVDQLKQEGIALSSISELFATRDGKSGFDALQVEIAKLAATRTIEAKREKVSADKQCKSREKIFNIELLGERPLLDLDNPFARFALQPRLLEIANSYFGMFTRLRYYNVWHTFASQEAPRQSQLWHRDREDFKILKVFVYLSDVDEGAGPLTYAKGSQLSGGLKRNPEHFIEGGVKRSTDEQMAAVVPTEQWFKATGPKGTIVFADTSGYHKGGLARTHDRLMYVCMFTSPASQSKELFERRGQLATPADKALAFALSPSAAAIF
jgi:hypothetical protein